MQRYYFKFHDSFTTWYRDWVFSPHEFNGFLQDVRAIGLTIEISLELYGEDTQA